MLAALAPLGDAHDLLLAGPHALHAHGLRPHALILGLADPPHASLTLVTRSPRRLPATVDAIARALRATGLDCAPHRDGLLIAQAYELTVAGENLRHPAVPHDPLPVISLDDAVGLAVRALHDRGLAGDVLDVASAAHLYSFLELESLGRTHLDSFSVHELLMRLEFVEEMDDERLDGEIRALVLSWIEEIKLRRAEEGDIDVDDPDLPALD
ncbi:hypothetical protein [Nonomuraea soli]|uniref:hypothetical protein n=1 Tax=Nonomuraea soli TaxID=1032476 RepID=UPI0031E771AE